jgi:hypothetical protein
MAFIALIDPSRIEHSEIILLVILQNLRKRVDAALKELRQTQDEQLRDEWRRAFKGVAGGLSLFEPVHGSSPPLAGKNVANPIGAILSAALMVEHLGWSEEAARIEAAVGSAVLAGMTTVDVGGNLGTREVGQEVVGRLLTSKA